MSVQLERLIAVFQQFVEAGLIDHNFEKALSVTADDVIGVGMGAQGIVTCKADVARIVGDGKADPQMVTEIEYVNTQARCYEDRFGTVCSVLKIKTTTAGKIVISTLGQIMSLRRQGDDWLICALQATPLFEQIEELEAYPIKFAENVLETYRQQEQIAKNAQNESVAVYLVNFTSGIFESAVVKNDNVIHTKKVEPYEAAMFDAAKKRLSEEDRFRFISTFSLGNVFKAYQNGQTELSLDYEMILPQQGSL